MISTHVLDTSAGAPAQGVKVVLEKLDGGWKKIGEGQTNSDGRFVFDCPYEAGDYRLTFAIEAYYGVKAFFLDTPISFRVTDVNRKYHVPLLLNPFGLSTYRGS